MFFIGFPHSLSTKTEEDIVYKNTILPTCSVNQIFYNLCMELSMNFSAMLKN